MLQFGSWNVVLKKKKIKIFYFNRRQEYAFFWRMSNPRKFFDIFWKKLIISINFKKKIIKKLF